MKAMKYVAPDDLNEALDLLKRRGDKLQILAGGTDLVPQMRSKVVAPKMLLDLRNLPLNHIQEDGDVVRIGACVTHSQLLESDTIARYFPALIEACADIAGPPVRNRATLGGNLVSASPAADLAPPLLVYDARVRLARRKKDRELLLDDFFIEPGKTALTKTELLQEVILPIPPPPTASMFIKMGKRRAMAVAVVSVAVRLSASEEGSISTGRIAFGSVAPTPMRATEAERLITGKYLSKELISEAAMRAAAEVSPISDLRASADYRRQMVEVQVARALRATWTKVSQTLFGKVGEYQSLTISMSTSDYEKVVKALNEISPDWGLALRTLLDREIGKGESND